MINLGNQEQKRVNFRIGINSEKKTELSQLFAERNENNKKKPDRKLENALF